MGLVTLTFDLLTLKLVCESHLRWGTFLNLGTLGLWVLELLPPTKEEVHVFARVCLFVCLSVSKITQKRVHGFR